MKIAKLIKPGEFEIVNGMIPENIGPDQALVRVKYVGICGTDLHIFRDGRSDITFPVIMGHELSGVVEKIGSQVHHIVPGDKVVLDPVISCNQCQSCKKEKYNICSQVKCFGVQIDGGYQEYILVDAKKLYVIPSGLSLQEAALAEPFSVACNIVARTSLEKNENVVIFGAGTIGLCTLQVCKALGCRVLITDTQPKKLDYAKEMGADMVVDSNKDDVAVIVSKFFPNGADVIIDAVGISTLFEKSLEIAAPASRIAVISFDSKAISVIPAEITRKELTIVGSRMNQGQFPQVLDLFKHKKLPHASKMISKIYPLGSIGQAFEYINKNSSTIIKVLIEI